MADTKQTQEQDLITKITKLIPGLLLLAGVAFIAQKAGQLFPLIGSVVFAILLGFAIRGVFYLLLPNDKSVEFTLKKLLKVAIILLGASLSFSEVTATGANAIAVIVAVVVVGILITVWFGKLLKIDNSLGLLIGVGTSICGATAITATKNVIQAKETQIAYAISTIFFFNLLATLLYPWIGHLLEMSDTMFGIWVGTAVHDTSSVVAVGYLFSDAAGETATTVKLIRTLFILPLLLIISLWWSKKQVSQDASSGTAQKIMKAFPWFILGFIGMSTLNSVNLIPLELKNTMVSVSKYLIIMVMVSVGLQVNIKKFVNLGAKPLLIGLFASVLVSILSLSLIILLNLG